MSHPVWVRGLKPPTPIQSEAIPIVAPRVGAWIETIIKYSVYLPL